MALLAGTSLGPYQILALIGQGGMGDVYMGRDTRLNRNVAIKVMRSATAAQRVRFEREGRAIAALRHPHICAIYDIGRDAGVDYLVMEYLEGETLAQRLRRGALPPAQALQFAIQIASALASAHRVGVIHRDLKPGNMMVTSTEIKLLDFGLAKIAAVAPVARGDADATLTAPLTEEGVVLGTIPYMAPEQLEGKEADSRSDIFALGAALYEMVTGQRAFPGASTPEIMASILKTDPPPVTNLQPLAPAVLDRVIQICLSKNPEDRWQSAHDIFLTLNAAGSFAGPQRAPRRGPRAMWIAVAILLLTSVASLLGWLWRARPEPPVVSFVVNANFGERLLDTRISPDGSRIALRVNGVDGRARIRVRSLGDLAAPALDGSEGAGPVFWSPDSKWLGFYANGQLKKAAVSTLGPAIVICDSPNTTMGAWSPENVIVFSGPGGLYRVPASGGTPQPLTRVDASRGERSHNAPVFLSDGRTFLYVAAGRDRVLHAGSLETSPAAPAKRIEGISSSNYAPAKASSGHLLYSQGAALMARAFNEKSLEIEGEPFIVANPAYNASAAHGTLTYITSETARNSASARLAWYDRSGKQLASLGDAAYWRSPALSRTGAHIAAELSVDDSGSDIHLMDPGRRVNTRFTSNGRWTLCPVWSPDGTNLVFSLTGAAGGLVQRPVSASAGDQVLTKSDVIQIATDWSRDGRFLMYTNDPGGQADIWFLPVSADRRSRESGPQPYLATEFRERWGRFSPDGKWVAYVSDESRRDEVFVESFPRGAGKWRISASGGSQPRWRSDGKELFYLSPDSTLMSVPVRGGPTFEPSTPVPMFTAPLRAPSFWASDYDVAQDGSRFLLATINDDSLSGSAVVVVNWHAAFSLATP